MERSWLKKKQKPAESAEPVARLETIRRHITILLERETLSAKDISQSLRISERDVYDHLEHIRKSIHKQGGRLAIIPAHCEKCRFTYAKRERLSKPGKCPLCHGSLIRPPVFHIETENG